MTEQNAIVIPGNYLSPAVDLRGALMRYEMVKKFIGQIMVDGQDYGKVPGSDKPTLLKPGAEKLASFFGLSPRFILEEKTEDWTGEQHGGEPFFMYRYKCQLYRGDTLIAEGEGSCNSWEKKYRYRQQERTCPNCHKSTIFRSKDKPEWYCWRKKGGCGAVFPADDTRIIGQEVGQIKNPDPAEQVNTMQKMAQKRSLVAPVLLATNASAMFTQDIEDFADGDWHETPPPAESAKPSPAPREMHTNPAQPKVGHDPEHDLGDLGFGQPKPAQPQEMHTEPPGEFLAGLLTDVRQHNWKSDKLTWQMAESVTSSDGVRYVDIDGAKLEHMRRSLVKSLAKAPDDGKNLKLDTILAIQNADKAEAQNV